MSKSGFSTLHRWLGRKNKDKSMGNGKLSKSSTNLSISSTNINETSQLEYNRITPLPAATTNAPFEQTFRITVLLPKDQLYVTRLGARVPLSKLLELVCDNKLLDREKYEFRNPVDSSQVYSCDLTIGAVGLSEIRLCHKSESYDNFNSDEIIKLHRTCQIRESLSSSEFSSRNSKHTTKTTSPYSSTNSLNSMDSSAISCGRSVKCQSKILAPPRKKRAAPRPPSQLAIPEKSSISESVHNEEQLTPKIAGPLAAKDFSISTPNLTSATICHSDINGNDCNDILEDCNDLSSGNGSLTSHGYNEDTVLYAQVQKKNALNSQIEPAVEINSKLPEPTPRKRIVVVKKKNAAPPAPAPPPRNSFHQDDAVSLASTSLSSNSTPTTPLDLSKSSLHDCEQSKQAGQEECDILNDKFPKPVPRVTTSTTLLNATDIEQDLKQIISNAEDAKSKPNISKVLLNRTPTPEPRSLSYEPPEVDHCYETQLEQFKQQITEEDCVSKQADSGIGEPVPSPIPDSLPSSVVSNLDVKLNHFESSSDDDDMVKVYNFKLGKTLVKPVNETKTLEELTVMNNVPEETEIDSEINNPLILAREAETTTPSTTFSETSSWNFAIPISPPPNFADQFSENFSKETPPDTPITPKIMERPILNFEVLKSEQELKDNKSVVKQQSVTTPQTPQTPLDSIVQELSTFIQEKGGVDSLMKKVVEPQEIEAAAPNTLSNFTIKTIQQSNISKPKEVLEENSTSEAVESVMNSEKPSTPSNTPPSTPDEDKLYRKRNSVSSLKQRRSVTRSDSFHSTAALNESITLNKRASSQLSLDQMGSNLIRRRSSSELSIAESPSLQSLEVIKNILNSRKNSLANSSEEEIREVEVNARRPSEELKFASLELKTFAKNLDKIEKDEQEQAEIKFKAKEEQAKELPKVYRYSGPPSINFSTWHERPKSQVAIKNEGDYIFGGGKSQNSAINKHLSVATCNNEHPPLVALKPTSLQRMGIPDKDYKVPLLVKSLKDVVIDNPLPHQKDPFRKSTTLANRPQVNGEIHAEQSAESYTQTANAQNALRSQTQVIPNTLPRNSARPTVEAVLRPQTQIIVNTSTMPRATKQRYSTPSLAFSGPQLLRSSSTKQQQEEAEKALGNQATPLPCPQILRSSSIKQQEIDKPSITTTQTSQAPFGQNTLRRTGLKEKILALEEQEKQKSQPQNLIPNGHLKQANQKSNNPITSAKLHLNLKHSNTSITTISSQPGCKTASPTSAFSNAKINLESSALKYKPSIPKTAPVLRNTNSFSYTMPPPPTPPPTSSITIQLKPVSPVETSKSSGDPRDVLLAAIRNFNVEALKKA